VQPAQFTNDSSEPLAGFRSPWAGARPLDGQVALVTGAGRGIGRGIAQELSASGAHVIAADLELPAAQETVSLLPQSGSAARVDTSDPDSVSELFGGALAGATIDVVVNVAGVLSVAPVTELAADEWDRVMGVNARGPFLVARAALPQMIERRRGSIINISSTSGKEGEPTLAHYCASKFAVIGFTQSLAREVAEFDIRVNAICPGVVNTPMIGQVAAAWGGSADDIAADLQLLKRPQDAREIGAAAVFLATMPSITGQAINVDGGTVFH
jgi:meso-butanediol dehydrogenase / (S,S)-butanediol dehydrogenase / diacetyl reductase